MTAKALMKMGAKHVDGLPFGHTSAAFIANWQFWRVMAILPNLKPYKPKRAKSPKYSDGKRPVNRK